MFRVECLGTLNRLSTLNTKPSTLLVPRRGVEPRPADSKSAVLIRHTRKAQVARPGIEPGLRASEALVRSGTLTGHRFQYPDLESNQDLNFRTVPCGPLHYRDMEPTAGFAPASAGLQDRRLSMSSHVGKHEREDLNPVRQFWRLAALPGAHSCKRPRSCDRERTSFTSAIQRSSTRR